MSRDIKDVNKKLSKSAGNIKPTDQQMMELAKLANKYKNKPESEIEKEMLRLADGFSQAEKMDLIKKLQMLKQMTGILDNNQRKKIDMFIKILS